MIGSSYAQKGRAAEMRTYVQGPIRQALNEIVHSGDVQPRPGNKFKDPSNKHDPRAQQVIEAAERALAQRRTRGGLRVPRRWDGKRRRKT